MFVDARTRFRGCRSAYAAPIFSSDSLQRRSEAKMTKGIDRVLLGGAFVFGGLLHRRVGQVDERVETIAKSVTEQAQRPPVPGMPLPTGYGLQVRGPLGEDIQIPVCLPPGFELGSLVLRPSFLPEEGGATRPSYESAMPASAVPEHPAAYDHPVSPVAPRPTAERLDAAIQMVYSDDAAFHTQVDGRTSLAPRAPLPEPERSRSIF
jgi:hypothetical protein